VVWNDPEEMGVPEDIIPENLVEWSEKIKAQGFEVEYFKFNESPEFNGFYVYSFSEEAPEEGSVEAFEKLKEEASIGEWTEYEDEDGTFYVSEVVFLEEASEEEASEEEKDKEEKKEEPPAEEAPVEEAGEVPVIKESLKKKVLSPKHAKRMK